eukprot:TRINITY_DN11764_c0_g1_i1.p1 TRINITY_DN11764_c0_g1~~TRINITY_DN11764_c0_g1_i1.p1  ORF type:complete len:351 (+),score=61.61 TRINITY_DN11764_c0_g1_i1:109-1053(+)
MALRAGATALQNALLYHPRSLDEDPTYRKLLSHMTSRLEQRGYELQKLQFHAPATEQQQQQQQRALLVTPTAEGERLRGPLWFVFGGNAMLSADWLQICEELLKSAGDAELPSFLLFDYPGYGDNPGEPGPAATLRSSRAALAEVLQLREEAVDGVKELPVLNLLGHSLGAAAAAQLAASLGGDECSDKKTGSAFLAAVKPGKLILSSPFLSIDEMASIILGPTLPKWLLRSLVTHRWDNTVHVPKAAGLGWQVSIVHPLQDEIVPASHGRALCEVVRAQGSTCELVQPEGCGHNDVLFAAFGSYAKLIGLSRL